MAHKARRKARQAAVYTVSELVSSLALAEMHRRASKCVIAYPPAEMPYAVLWVLSARNPFHPPSGHVVTMQQEGLS